MSKPRVFISSTYYDLKQTREDIAVFLSSLGYEPVRNEEGNIPYGSEESLSKYCYREIQNVDILISIIGGRFGSSAQDSQWSISNEELKTALKNKKQVYIFIDKSVDAEYGTYLVNKGKDITFKYVDNIKIYQFIEEIRSLSNNNNIKAFDSSADILHYLKEQLAGLFQSFLSSQSREREIDLASKLEITVKNLEKMVDSLVEINKGNQAGVTNLMKMAHPIVKRLSELLGIRFGFWLECFDDLDNLLMTAGWSRIETEDSEVSSYEWEKFNNVLVVDKTIFDEMNLIKDIKFAEWDDKLIIIESRLDFTDLVDSDVPF